MKSHPRLILAMMILTLLVSACGLLPGGTEAATPAADETQSAAGSEASEGTAAPGDEHETPAPSGTQSAAATHIPVQPAGPLQDAAGLVSALQAAGASASMEGEINQTFLPVVGVLVKVDGESLQVYEFTDAAAAEAEAARISPDGGLIGENVVEWITAPRFYRSGSLLVLYIGGEEKTIGLLENLLGPPFAGAGSLVAQTTQGPEGHSQTPGSTQQPEGHSRTPGAAPSSCAQPDAHLVSYENTEAGYCLMIPIRFQIGAIDPKNVFINGPAVGEGPEPVRAIMNISVEGGFEDKNLAQVVDEATQEYQDLPLSRIPGALGGGPAVIVEGLPGRTGTRQVFALHGGKLYHLILGPVDPAFPEVEGDVEELWDAVIESFVFLEEGT